MNWRYKVIEVQSTPVNSYSNILDLSNVSETPILRQPKYYHPVLNPYCPYSYYFIRSLTIRIRRVQLYLSAFQDLSYEDKHWHERCFVCTQCKEPLVEKMFGFMGDKLYCDTCYENLFGIKCDACGLPFRAGQSAHY